MILLVYLLLSCFNVRVWSTWWNNISVRMLISLSPWVELEVLNIFYCYLGLVCIEWELCKDAENRWTHDLTFRFKFKRKIRTWTGIRISDFYISVLALYHLSYPGSIKDTDLNFSLESNAMQGVVVCDTMS